MVAAATGLTLLITRAIVLLGVPVPTVVVLATVPSELALSTRTWPSLIARPPTKLLKTAPVPLGCPRASMVDPILVIPPFRTGALMINPIGDRPDVLMVRV